MFQFTNIRTFFNFFFSNKIFRNGFTGNGDFVTASVFSQVHISSVKKNMIEGTIDSRELKDSHFEFFSFITLDIYLNKTNLTDFFSKYC